MLNLLLNLVAAIFDLVLVVILWDLSARLFEALKKRWHKIGSKLTSKTHDSDTTSADKEHATQIRTTATTNTLETAPTNIASGVTLIESPMPMRTEVGTKNEIWLLLVPGGIGGTLGSIAVIVFLVLSTYEQKDLIPVVACGALPTAIGLGTFLGALCGRAVETLVTELGPNVGNIAKSASAAFVGIILGVFTTFFVAIG